MGRQISGGFRTLERGRERLWTLAEWGLYRSGAALEQAQWRRDPVTRRWWFAISADIVRVERETPTAQELGRRAGEAINNDPRQRAYVEGLARQMIERVRAEREKPGD